MRVEIKWIEGIRKRPVPARYACNINLKEFPLYYYSVILHFPQQVRTWAELELVVVKDFEIPDGVFYITEGGRVVAEAQRHE